MKINREEYAFLLRKIKLFHCLHNSKDINFFVLVIPLALIYFTLYAVTLAKDYTRPVSPLKGKIKRTDDDLHIFSQISYND